MDTEVKLNRMKRAVNDLITDIKTRTFPVDRIILFGSVVNGGFNEYSDLDVCICHENELTIRQMREIEMYFKDALSDEMDVDFIYCTHEKLRDGQHVFERIRKEGRVLYEHL